MDEQYTDVLDTVEIDDICEITDIEGIILNKKSKKKKKKNKPKNEVPSIQRAWNVGYSAAQANLPETRNPFKDIGSEEFTAWLEGWWSGFYDEPLHLSLSS